MSNPLTKFDLQQNEDVGIEASHLCAPCVLFNSQKLPLLLSLLQDQHTVVGQNTGPSPSPNSCSNPNTASGYMNSQQSLLNQQMMGKKQPLQRPAMEPKQQLLLQQQMLSDSVKLSPDVYGVCFLTLEKESVPLPFCDSNEGIVDARETKSHAFKM